MKNNKLILLQNKENYKLNIFSISHDSKIIPLFNNKENINLLFFDKVLPYFDGIELMLNDKYIFKEITQESWDKCVKLLDLSQYEQERIGYSIFYKKDGKYYIEQILKNDWFLLDHTLIWSVFKSKIDYNYHLIKKITKCILEEVYKCKVVSVRFESFAYLNVLDEINKSKVIIK